MPVNSACFGDSGGGFPWGANGLMFSKPCFQRSVGGSPQVGGHPVAAGPVFLVLHFEPERLTSKIFFLTFKRDNTRNTVAMLPPSLSLMFVRVPPGESQSSGVPVSLPAVLGKGKSLCSQESTPDLPGPSPDTLLQTGKKEVWI